MFRRPRNTMDSGNQQHSTINDSQTIIVYSLMDRVLKQGDAIEQMEATLVGISYSWSSFSQRSFRSV